MKRTQFLKMMVSLPLGIGPFAARRLQRSEGRQRYLLNKFYVAGFQYYEGPSVIQDIQPDETLRLAADPGNDYDKFAVSISRRGVMLGHVPRSDNKHISRLLRQDVDLQCRVMEVNPERETWKMLKTAIYL